MDKRILPDIIFESSWEVCNKVGGIYTVLSSRAKTLHDGYGDNLVFIGPDLWQDRHNPLFMPDASLFAPWTAACAGRDGLKVRAGRWDIPGSPAVVLVDFSASYERKNDIYAAAWRDFGLDSLHAYGDYDEASMFSYAAGRVVESFYNYYYKDKPGIRAVYQAHEWMSSLGLLYVRKHVPAVATVFTTHATTVGRSIAGNNKPLYDYLPAYNGDQMACELNVRSKHSAEKCAAHNADCFTTVSEITAGECSALLDKTPDVVQMNGFEEGFVPSPPRRSALRRAARKRLLEVAGCLTGTVFSPDTLLVSIGGRYEFKNKGIDVFVDAVANLNSVGGLDRDVLAFVFVPAWVFGPRHDLLGRLDAGQPCSGPLPEPFITHWLHDMGGDMLLSMMRSRNIDNLPGDKAKLVFVPCYLSGDDGVVGMPYYDLLPAMDLNIYPSYYEPWGYTPLESMAFGVPTVTTDLAGFGLWVKSLGLGGSISGGVQVVHRSDGNYGEAVAQTADVVRAFSRFAPAEVSKARKSASALAKRALWNNFIGRYYDAYNVALRNAAERNAKIK